MQEYGTLYVRATTASGAYPVADVNVSISGASEVGKNTRISVLTGEDGLTQALLLPAPARALSLSPGGTQEAYSRYDIEIYKDGYYKKKLFDVAVFSGITSILPVNMIPATPYNTDINAPLGDENVFITENPNL